VLLLLACGVALFLMTKIFIFDHRSTLAARREELRRIEEQTARLQHDLEAIHERHEPALPEEKARRAMPLREKFDDGKLFELLLPNASASRVSLRKLEMEDRPEESLDDLYAVRMKLTAKFGQMCEYLRFLEQERPALICNTVRLSPWKQDSTVIHLELQGLIFKE